MDKKFKAIKNNSLKKLSLLSAVAFVASCAIVANPENLKSGSAAGTSAFFGKFKNYFGFGEDSFGNWLFNRNNKYDYGNLFKFGNYYDDYLERDNTEDAKKDMKFISDCVSKEFGTDRLIGSIYRRHFYYNSDIGKSKVVQNVVSDINKWEEFKYLTRNFGRLKYSNGGISKLLSDFGKNLEKLQNKIYYVLSDLYRVITDFKQYKTEERAKAASEVLDKSNIDSLLKHVDLQSILAKDSVKSQAKEMLSKAIEGVVNTSSVDYANYVDEHPFSDTALKHLNFILKILLNINAAATKMAFRMNSVVLTRRLSRLMVEIFRNAKSAMESIFSRTGISNYVGLSTNFDSKNAVDMKNYLTTLISKGDFQGIKRTYDVLKNVLVYFAPEGYVAYNALNKNASGLTNNVDFNNVKFFQDLIRSLFGFSFVDLNANFKRKENGFDKDNLSSLSQKGGFVNFSRDGKTQGFSIFGLLETLSKASQNSSTVNNNSMSLFAQYHEIITALSMNAVKMDAIDKNNYIGFVQSPDDATDRSQSFKIFNDQDGLANEKFISSDELKVLRRRHNGLSKLFGNSSLDSLDFYNYSDNRQYSNIFADSDLSLRRLLEIVSDSKAYSKETVDNLTKFISDEVVRPVSKTVLRVVNWVTSARAAFESLGERLYDDLKAGPLHIDNETYIDNEITHIYKLSRNPNLGDDTRANAERIVKGFTMSMDRKLYNSVFAQGQVSVPLTVAFMNVMKTQNANLKLSNIARGVTADEKRLLDKVYTPTNFLCRSNIDLYTTNPQYANVYSVPRHWLSNNTISNNKLAAMYELALIYVEDFSKSLSEQKKLSATTVKTDDSFWRDHGFSQPDNILYSKVYKQDALKGTVLNYLEEMPTYIVYNNSLLPQLVALQQSMKSTIDKFASNSGSDVYMFPRKTDISKHNDLTTRNLFYDKNAVSFYLSAPAGLMIPYLTESSVAHCSDVYNKSVSSLYDRRIVDVSKLRSMMDARKTELNSISKKFDDRAKKLESALSKAKDDKKNEDAEKSSLNKWDDISYYGTFDSGNNPINNTNSVRSFSENNGFYNIQIDLGDKKDSSEYVAFVGYEKIDNGKVEHTGKHYRDEKNQPIIFRNTGNTLNISVPTNMFAVGINELHLEKRPVGNTGKFTFDRKLKFYKDTAVADKKDDANLSKTDDAKLLEPQKIESLEKIIESDKAAQVSYSEQNKEFDFKIPFGKNSKYRNKQIAVAFLNEGVKPVPDHDFFLTTVSSTGDFDFKGRKSNTNGDISAHLYEGNIGGKYLGKIVAAVDKISDAEPAKARINKNARAFLKSSSTKDYAKGETTVKFKTYLPDDYNISSDVKIELYKTKDDSLVETFDATATDVTGNRKDGYSNYNNLYQFAFNAPKLSDDEEVYFILKLRTKETDYYSVDDANDFIPDYITGNVKFKELLNKKETKIIDSHKDRRDNSIFDQDIFKRNLGFLF